MDGQKELYIFHRPISIKRIPMSTPGTMERHRREHQLGVTEYYHTGKEWGWFITEEPNRNSLITDRLQLSTWLKSKCFPPGSFSEHWHLRMQRLKTRDLWPFSFKRRDLRFGDACVVWSCIWSIGERDILFLRIGFWISCRYTDASRWETFPFL